MPPDAPELLINISLRFPQLDRAALGAQLADVLQAAVAAGGNSTLVSIQPYDPDEDVDEEES